MHGLVLHAQTALLLGTYTSQPAHALALIGPDGSGKQAIAYALMQDVLGLPATTLVSDYPYVKIITPEKDKTAIGIEAIRELQHFAALKVPGEQAAKRFIFIPHSHSMTTEAQNALLKLLEEPPEDTYFILTTHTSQALLPTIQSRTQQLAIHRPAKADLEQHFAAQGHEAQTIQQAYFMSGGLPGLMNALLSGTDHPLKAAAHAARQLLQASPFERLCKVDELSKKRPDALQLLIALRHMAQAALEQTAHSGAAGEAATKRIKQWHKVLQASFDAEKAYAVSAQAKLTLTNLMLTL